MDWIKQNKFLAVWLAVTLAGVGALGFLFVSAKASYAEAQDNYTTKIGELQNLQNQSPYPEEENLKKMQELQKAHQGAIDSLRQQLAKTELPQTPVSAVKFQDELRESVRRVTTLATDKGTKLPDKFYMGFDRYQAEPPKDEAAAPLGRMLKAIELAVTTLLNTGATELSELKRDPLPEEGLDKPGTTPPQPASAGGKAKDAKEGSDLVKKQPFDLTFIANEARFRRFLNDLIASKTQFFIPKSVVVENEKLVGPPKLAGISPALQPPPLVPGTPGTPGGTGRAGAAPAGPAVVFVVGEEKLKVALRVEVADFADLPATPTK